MSNNNKLYNKYEKAFEELKDIYADLAEEISTLQLFCHQCGKCCDFISADHMLYLSLLEKFYLIGSDSNIEFTNKSCLCPYQDCKTLVCLAHNKSALGCRLYYCKVSDKLKLEKISEKYHQKLKDLHNKHKLPWDYQPLLKI